MTEIEKIAYAKSLGIDFIVCDHHVPDEVLPCAVAILNPKRVDSTYPCPHLSGCGVGFKFMQAFAMDNGIPADQLYPLLDLVAVSIASDLVPIVGENRILAFHGIKQINHSPSIGLKAIINVCGLEEKEISINDIIFKIGPRINASGRIQQGKMAVDLLIENNLQAALEMSYQINEFNEARKEIDKSMTEEANNIVAGLESFEERRAIVIFNPDWHRGVIGIVAPYRGLSSSGCGYNMYGRYCYRLCTLCDRFRPLQGNGELSRPARQFRRTHLCRRFLVESGEYRGFCGTFRRVCHSEYIA